MPYDRFAIEDGDLIVAGPGVLIARDFEYGTGPRRPPSYPGPGDLMRSAKDLRCEWLDLCARSGAGDDIVSRLNGLRNTGPVEVENDRGAIR